MKLWILITAILILLAELSHAAKVPTCEAMSDQFSRSTSIGSSVKNLEALPKLVLLAKDAKIFIENKKHSFQLIAFQSFLNAQSKILCSTLPNEMEKNFSIYAPTLIDLSSQRKIGNSFWQFHISVEKSQLGMWNKKTRMFNSVKDIEKILQQNGLQLSIQQISHDDFEMTFARETAEESVRLVIRFDATKSLP